MPKIPKKLCGKCGLIKTVRAFHKDRARGDGYRVVCKGCRVVKPDLLKAAGLKICRKCLAVKRVEDFYPQNAKCKACY